MPDDRRSKWSSDAWERDLAACEICGAGLRMACRSVTGYARQPCPGRTTDPSLAEINQVAAQRTRRVPLAARQMVESPGMNKTQPSKPAQTDDREEVGSTSYNEKIRDLLG